MMLIWYDSLSWLDQIIIDLSVPLISAYFFFGLDDFIVDFMSWVLGCHPAELKVEELVRMLDMDQKRIAILVASWKEGGVLRKMVEGNLRGIQYKNYEFVLGVYPNDPETFAEARELAERHAHVRVVVNSSPGPTSKGQMLNEMVRTAVIAGRAHGKPFQGFIIHDSEDLIHRYSLAVINQCLDKHDFVQVPIFSLPVEKSEFVAGTYIDEFSESHTKDILLRHRLGVSIPSAGAGPRSSARLVDAYMTEQEGKLLNERSLTEDYELGVSTSKYGLGSNFACFYFENEKGDFEFIATREYFPKAFSRSIRQKTRWTIGIAFQGIENLGWKGGLLHKYFLYRDRKGPYANLIVAIGALIFIYGAVRSVSNFESFKSDVRVTDHLLWIRDQRVLHDQSDSSTDVLRFERVWLWNGRGRSRSLADRQPRQCHRVVSSPV